MSTLQVVFLEAYNLHVDFTGCLLGGLQLACRLYRLSSWRLTTCMSTLQVVFLEA